MSNRPLVSVVIPTYNRVGSIERSVKSALLQTVRDVEVIVVDDASSDGTSALVAAMDDPRVQYIRRGMRGGGGAARNTGLFVARGEFVAFLDSDDEWLPHKLERQLHFVERDEQALVMCGFERRQGCTRRQALPAAIDAKDPARRLLELSGGPMSCSLFLVPLEPLLAADIRFDPRLPALQDLDFALQLALSGFSIVGPREPLVKKFRDPDGLHVYNATSSIDARRLLIAKYREPLGAHRPAYRRQMTVLAASLARSGRKEEGAALLRSFGSGEGAEWRDRFLKRTASWPRAIRSYEWTVRKSSGVRKGLLARRARELAGDLVRWISRAECEPSGRRASR